MRYTQADLQELASQASNLARRVGVRRFVMRPGKLTQLLHQLGNARGLSAAEVGPDELADALQLLPLAQYHLEQIELRLISEARERKMSWVEIAQSLSLRSRQAAEQRFLRLRAAHGTSAGGRDVAPARVQRRRQNEFLELVNARYSISRQLAKLLPSAIEEELYASATGPVPKNAGATWDRLPVDERANQRDKLMGVLAPHLRALRTFASEGENEPIALFLALGRLIARLDRSGYRFDTLPSELVEGIDALRELMTFVNPRVFAAAPALPG
jgi:hypothetical protein